MHHKILRTYFLSFLQFSSLLLFGRYAVIFDAIKAIFHFLIITFTFVFLPHPNILFGSNISPDGSTNTSVSITPNETPLLNIAAPNGAGMSYNSFDDYNVGTDNLVINNSINEVDTSFLAGALQGNPNFNGVAANLVVNEVTSNKISKIAGYTEIFGQKADLVIANPNGIVVNGGGFINIANLSLIAGSSQNGLELSQNNQIINQYNINPDSQITITARNVAGIGDVIIPLGIDANDVDRANLIARITEITGSIYANKLDILTGNHKAIKNEEGNWQVNSQENNQLSEIEFAIDAKYFGAIYADQIYIIATEDGVGVKAAANVVSNVNNIVIEANGDVRYQNLIANDGDINISTSADISNVDSQNPAIINANQIDITANNLTSDGSIYANDVINLNINNNLVNNDLIYSVNNLNINSGNFTNNIAANIISELADINITANNLSNYSILNAANDLVININDEINNDFAIGAGQDINIYANNLNNSGFIQAVNNLNINGDNIINTNTKAQPDQEQINGLIANNININSQNIDNDNGFISATDQLLLKNEIAENIFGNLNFSNNSGYLASGSLTNLNLGSENDYIIQGDILSEGNIIIIANNIENAADNILANNIAINANGYITNQLNKSLNAINNLTLTANGNINNYGYLTAQGDLSLISNNANINNYKQIAAGNISNFSAININNYQNDDYDSKISSINNLLFDAINLNNYSLIESASDITANLTNNFANHPTAFIYSGNNINFNIANIFNNNQADIYAQHNLIIQNQNQNNITAFHNISGNIESYLGDITIKANSFENKALGGKEQMMQRFVVIDGFMGPWGPVILDQGHFDFWVEGDIGPAAIINSGSNINIMTNNFKNDIGSIIANNDIIINSLGDFENKGYHFEIGRKYYSTWPGASDEQALSDVYYSDVEFIGGGFVVGITSIDYEIHNSQIKSGNSIQINAGNFNNSSIISQYADIGNNNQIVNNINIANLQEAGIIDIDYSNYQTILEAANSDATTIAIGAFIANINNPDANYLYESRSQFTDLNQYYGSDYYFDLVDFNPEDIAAKQLGDAYFENIIIKERLMFLKENSLYLSDNHQNDYSQEIKNLFDNAAIAKNTLGLEIGKSLNEEQRNNLDEDIIWMESITFNNQKYLVPKLYLSNTTLNQLINQSDSDDNKLAVNSTIFAASDINLNIAGDLINQNANIIAGNDINILAANIINNSTANNYQFKNQPLSSKSLIESLNNNINLIANNNISNIGSILKAKNQINLTAANDIINSSKVATNDRQKINNDNLAYYKTPLHAFSSSNIYSEISNIADIKAGEININSGNNFTNQAANLETIITQNQNGNINIDVGNNIHIDTLELRNRSERYWFSKKGGGREITDITNNIASNINSSGNISLTSQNGNINLIGSKLSAANDININSGNDVNILNAINSYHKETHSYKKSSFKRSNSSAIRYFESALKSSLDSGGDINISSFGDTILQAANINSDNNLTIGSFTIDQNQNGGYKQDENGNYITISGNVVDNLTIKNADLTSYQNSYYSKGYRGIAAAAMQISSYILPSSSFKIKFLSERKQKEKNTLKSTLNIAGSMMANSLGDTIITGSDINIGGDLLANSAGDFTINSAQNNKSDISYQSYENSGKLNFGIGMGGIKMGVSKEKGKMGQEMHQSNVVSSNINISGSSLVNSFGEFNLIASNFITNNQAQIIAKNNLNITDGKNTKSQSSFEEKIKTDIGIKIGNVYLDAASSLISGVDAQKNLQNAYQKLNKIENLHKQDKASAKAVERARYQLFLSLVNSGLSVAQAMQSVGNAITAAKSSLGTGFYGGFYADITKSTASNKIDISQSIAANLIAGGNLSLQSGTEDINIFGSNVISNNGNLNLNAMLGNLNIKAGESTYSQESKFKSQNLGGSVGTNGYSANIGFSESGSTIDQTTFTNSQITAKNGILNINIANDANIRGANLSAQDVIITIGGNLLLKSKQNLLETDSYSTGISASISTNHDFDIDGGSGGINMANGFASRAWVDQASSIIASNSVNINVGNNTNIIGAVIANQDSNGNDLGNLILNTKKLTFSNLQNHYDSKSNNFAANLAIGKDPENPTASGSLIINTAMKGNQSSSTNQATIGKGIININGVLTNNNINRNIAAIEANQKQQITSDFEIGIAIDNRLIMTALYKVMGDEQKAQQNWGSYKSEVKQGIEGSKTGLKLTGEVLESSRLLAQDHLPYGIGHIITMPTSLIEGTIFTFLEEDSLRGSYLMSKYGVNMRPDLTKDYAVNGISTTAEHAIYNYIYDEDQDITARYNPTHGFLGDLVEAGIGKLSNMINVPQIVAMNKIVANDLYQRRNVKNATNTFHSQGTIIGIGAMKFYAGNIMKPIQLTNPITGDTYYSHENRINQTQKFIALGPAVLKEDWYEAAFLLGNGVNANANWVHDSKDSVRYLTSPTNLVNYIAKTNNNGMSNSLLYVPNLIFDVPIGIWNLTFNLKSHDIKNPLYSQFLKSNNQNYDQSE